MVSWHFLGIGVCFYYNVMASAHITVLKISGDVYRRIYDQQF